MSKEDKSVEVQFWEAYAAMQGEISDVTKGHENNAFKNNGKASTYANLADVLSTCRAVWTKHGFAIVQNCRSVYYETTNVVRMSIAVDTIVSHKAGHKETFAGLEVLVTNVNAHGIASAVTYGRRISLMPILGITGADDDDDGNGATGNSGITGKKAGEQRAKPVSSKKQTPEQERFIEVQNMTNEAVKAEFEGYGFSAEDMEAMRLANIASQRIAITRRREFTTNEDFIATLGTEG